MSGEKRIRILLADDHPMVRDGLATTLGCQEDMVVVAQASDGEEEIFRAMRALAKGYLLKDRPREELIAGIRAVCAGKRALSPNAAASLAGRTPGCELTARELEVLRLMARGKNNQEIAGALFITEGTVKSHVNHILAKLGVEDRTQAVVTALKRGVVNLV